MDHKISGRVGRVLNLFLVGLLLLLLRVWYLGVIQYDTYFQESRRPQRRTVVEPVERATIRDRFNIPLATNQVQYNAAICYADIRQIPSIRWEKDESGARKKIFARRQYIDELAQFLANALEMDAQVIEDLIHGKASLFPHTPFVIKENLPESLYYRLKSSEKDWLGLQMQRAATRIYPLGKCGCDVIGYLGAIDDKQYFTIAQELKNLKKYLSDREEGKVVMLPHGFKSPLEVRERLRELEERGYNICDLIGKSGVESGFDESLRGIYGKKTFEIDPKGNCLRELPGSRSAMGGERLILSISSQLQELAEELLAERELHQDQQDDARGGTRRHPFIRGGSIVAMHPETGEILALASTPRYDPNDFVRRNLSNIHKWLEDVNHLAEIWNGKRSIERELFSPKVGGFYTEAEPLTWESYLKTILPKDGQIYRSLCRVKDLNTALEIQDELVTLKADSIKEALKGQLPPLLDSFLSPITHINDKLLFLDLVHLLIRREDLTLDVRNHIGNLTFSDWHFYCQAVARHKSDLQEEMRKLFHEIDFKSWRSEHFKEFLQKKREEEKQSRRWARPYTDYLSSEEKRLFNEWWQIYRVLFLHVFITGELPPSPDVGLKPYLAYLLNVRSSKTDEPLNDLRDLLVSLDPPRQLDLIKALRSFEDLKNPLFGRYPLVRTEGGVQLERHLACAFYPSGGFGYGRSQAYRQATPFGSVFKLVSTYGILKERNDANLPLNPMTIVDEGKTLTRTGSNSEIVGYFESGEPIRRFYNGGRLPRSSRKMGRIDLTKAVECSSNIYFSILAGEYLQNELKSYASLFGMGEKTGIDLPGEYKGILPNDTMRDRTGLYAFAIGQHSLVVTPLQAATMISAIANGGKILKPQIVKFTAGKQLKKDEKQLFNQKDFPYKDKLALIGLTFPLFTQPLEGREESYISLRGPEVRSTIPLPDKVREKMVEAMHLVINGSNGNARPSIISPLYHNPDAIKAYHSLQHQMIGKTGTAEILYKQTIDAETPAVMETHIWFTGIAFKDSSLTEPELVVAVFLRFGYSGKEGGPLAARIVEKWREISSR